MLGERHFPAEMAAMAALGVCCDRGAIAVA